MLGSLVDAWAIGARLSLIRAAAARKRLYALYLVPDSLIEDGVGEEHETVRAGVRVVLLFGRWARWWCARLLHANLLSRLAGPRELVTPRGRFHYSYSMSPARLLVKCFPSFFRGKPPL